MTDKIKKDVASIMASFMKALSKAEGAKEKFGSERENSMRDPGTQDTDKSFRQRMFSNAPKHRDSFIIMEKKHW